jgi:predicted SAM-dependent methyltransferase
LPNLINLACGQTFDSRWINLDQHASADDVKAHDLRNPLPFLDNFADAIYCSHFLEHLDVKMVDKFLSECLRCLKPRGVLRVVVPDFERMAKDYLKILSKIETGETRSIEHAWMHLEIFDQFSRNRPEGLMNAYLRNPHVHQNEFIRSRIGEAIDNFQVSSIESKSVETSLRSKLRMIKFLLFDASYRTHILIKKIFPKKYNAFLISPGKSFFNEILQMIVPELTYLQIKQALFRNSGEVHLQSYDQYNLKQKLSEAGFGEIQKVTSRQSAIPNWNDYLLDINPNGNERKADSLYMEAKKTGS